MLASTEKRNREGECDTFPHLGEVSIVVPIGAGEGSWLELLRDFEPLPAETEVLLVTTTSEPESTQELLEQLNLSCHVLWGTTTAGRAQQMNKGAQLASKPYVWFLHADSRLSSEVFRRLDQALQENVDTLMYFDLAFLNDGPSATRWNSLGSRFRSRVLGVPFGDQGFCLQRDTFLRLGGYNEQASYGEDHLLVWTARQQGVSLQPLDATISTSARKYAHHGWLKTTLAHWWLTLRQAVPQWWKLVIRQGKQ